MTTASIIFTVCYALVLGLYLFTETSGKMLWRAPNKIVLSAMFLVFGIIQFSIKPNFGLSSFHTVLMAALVLAFLGDVFLLFDFVRGGDFFMAANFAFIIYQFALLSNEGLVVKDYWWFFLAAIIILAIVALGIFKYTNLFKLGNMKVSFFFYLASITISGILGIVVLALTPYKLLGIGVMLSMISDYFLGVYKFTFKNRWILRANSLTYFAGMLLIVLQMSL